MKLEEYLDDPIKAFLKAERYINDGSPSGFSINTTTYLTSPLSNIETFYLYKVKFDESITIKYIGGDEINGEILIHPDMLNNVLLSKNKPIYCEKDVLVSPTASGRTVYDIKNKRFIKLAYLDYLGRMIRHMEENKILSSCEVTRQLEKVIESGRANPKFSFLKENIGRIAYLPYNKEDIKKLKIPKGCMESGLYEWGVIYRESIPYPYIDEEEFLIPFFSLFGKEYNATTKSFNKEHELLVLQLFKKQTKCLEKFLLEDILFPLFHTYFDALLLGGIELEAHAQNMLITVTKEFKINRIVCRDLESAGRDIELMKYLGIDFEEKASEYKYNIKQPKQANQKYDKYITTHSFMFDFKLGEYIVTPMLEAISEKMKINVKRIRRKIKKYNSQFIKYLPADFFPEEWCTYDSINFDALGKERVYHWHSKPKYR